MRKLLSSFVFALVCATFVLSQTTAGRLSGTVTGPDGALPGATVVATDVKTGRELTATTNESGNFVFPQLEFGTYTVRVTATGFKAFVANEVKVDVGREYSLNPRLEIGDIQETVTVTAGADVVTANSAQISNTVSPQQILSLPLITRNPLSLTTLQPGVQSNPFQNTTINGMRTTFTNITRDGINIQDTFIRSNATDFAPGRPSVDDTGEFTISTGNTEPDQGYGGAQIRLVTPRGTKDFHGALFAYNRNSEFAANNFFNNRSGLERPFRNRNQFGGKISGPLPFPGFGEGTPYIHKDKAVFFFNYEGIRDPVSARGTRTILSPSARAGAFTWNRTTAGTANQFCPSGAAGSVCTIPNLLTFARTNLANGTTIPATVDPIIQSQVISRLPTESNFTGGDGLNTLGYTLNRASNQTRNQYSSRIDVDFTDKYSLLGIYNFNKEENLRPDVDTTGFTTTPGVNQFSENTQFTAAFRSIITNSFVNEIRGGWFNSDVPFDRTDPVPDYFLGIPVVTNPEHGFLDQGRATKAYNLQNNADWILGNHTVRFGGQMQFFKVDAYNDVGTVPTVTVGTGTNTPSFTTGIFSSLGGINTTQLGMANGLLALFGGFYTNVSQSFNMVDINTGFQRGATELRPFRYENHSLYAMDRWQVNKELTLTLGLRYELFPALRLLSGLALEPLIEDPDNPLPSLMRQNGTYVPIGTNSGTPNAYYKTDYNNFAPHIGFAWTPNFETGILGFLTGRNRTVFRGGYSHVYGNDSIVTSINNAAVGNQGLGRTGLQFTNLNGRLSSGSIPVVPVPANPVFPRTYLENNTAAFSNFGTVFGIDPNIQTPMVEQYSFGVQREFFGNMALEVRYVGTRSKNLARGVDFNQIDIFNNGFFADFERARSNLSINTAERNARIAACVAAGGTTAACTTQVNTALPLSAGFNPALAGSVPLTLLTKLPNVSSSPGGIGSTTAAINATIAGHFTNGTPADLALVYITNNLNNHPSLANPNAVPIIPFVANPATGVVDLFMNDGEYYYNSLQVELRRRFANGLYFQTNYTFSKNLTNAVGTSQNLFEPYLDINNKDLDWQRADYDQTHTFNFNGIYQLPFGRGKMFLNQGGVADFIFGGWELSGLMQWSTGAPISFLDTRGTLNRAARSARQTANSNLTADQIRSLMGVYEANGNIYWIDPSIINANGQASAGFGSTPFDGQVFFNVNPGQTGNLGRTLVNGPATLNVDMALLKNFRFGESMRLQLRAEAFNVFNRVNFFNNTQFQNINSSTFGQITSAAAARQMQFAARFEF